MGPAILYVGTMVKFVLRSERLSSILYYLRPPMQGASYNVRFSPANI